MADPRSKSLLLFRNASTANSCGILLVCCGLRIVKVQAYYTHFVPSSVPALPGDGPQAVSGYDSIVFYLTNTNPCAIPVAIIILQACCLDVQFRIIVELLEFHNIISWVCS